MLKALPEGCEQFAAVCQMDLYMEVELTGGM